MKLRIINITDGIAEEVGDLATSNFEKYLTKDELKKLHRMDPDTKQAWKLIEKGIGRAERAILREIKIRL